MPETTTPVRFTIPTGRATAIVWQLAAYAECVLGPYPGDHTQDGLPLYADEDGFVRFHVRPVDSCDKLVKLVMRCKVRDREMLHPLELRVGDKPSDDFPAPPREGSFKPKGARVRPALTSEEALHLSDEELRLRGHSIRPDPETAPDAFLAWRRVALAPMTFVNPRSVPRPDIVRARPKKLDAGAPANSANWSGFELRSGSGQPYDYVMGQWNVPALVGSETGGSSVSLMWIGLDGDGTSDLVQAGTGQYDTFMSGMHIVSYFAWTEFLPQQPMIQQAMNIVVNANDEMLVQVFSGWAGGSEAEFVLYNVTTGLSTAVITPKGSTIVGGTEAEWIMERTQFGTVFGDLADYGSAVMSGAYARIANTRSGYVAYQGNTNLQITMVNGSNVLSTVTPIDSASMRFTWKNYK
jgi:hypothetical protein